MRIRMQVFSFVVTAVSIISSAGFAAKAASHFLEAVFFGEPTRAVKRERPIVAAAPPVRRSKDGSQLTSRNMFCAECTPSPQSAMDPSQVPITSLPLVLVATAVSAEKGRSMASIEHTGNGKQGAYREGDALPGAGPIVTIRFQWVDFENAGRVERLLLGGAGEPPVLAAVAPQPSPSPTPAAGEGDLASVLDAGIRKVDDTTYEVDRGLVDQALANPMGFLKGGRAAPSVVDGKPNGFKLYAIRPGSAMAKLGLRSGDTIQSVNGVELASIEAAMNLYAKVRELSSFEIAIERRGKPTTMRYTVR